MQETEAVCTFGRGSSASEWLDDESEGDFAFVAFVAFVAFEEEEFECESDGESGLAIDPAEVIGLVGIDASATPPGGSATAAEAESSETGSAGAAPMETGAPDPPATEEAVVKAADPPVPATIMTFEPAGAWPSDAWPATPDWQAASEKQANEPRTIADTAVVMRFIVFSRIFGERLCFASAWKDAPRTSGITAPGINFSGRGRATRRPGKRQ